MGETIKFSKLNKTQQDFVVKFDKDGNKKLKKQEAIDFKNSVAKSSKPRDIAMDISVYLRCNARSLSDKEFVKKFEKINKDNVLEVLKQFKEVDDENSLIEALLSEHGNKENRTKIINNIINAYFEATGHKGKPSTEQVNKIVAKLCKHPHGIFKNARLKLLNAYTEPMKRQNANEIADGLYQVKKNNKKFVNKPEFTVLMEKVNSDNVDKVFSEYKKHPENKNGEDLFDAIENSSGRKKHKREAIGHLFRLQLDEDTKNNKTIQEAIENSLNKEEINDVKNLLYVLRNRQNTQNLVPMYEKLHNKSENKKEYAKILLNKDSLGDGKIQQIQKEYEKATGKTIMKDLAKNPEAIKILLTTMQEDAKLSNDEKLLKYIDKAAKSMDGDDIQLLSEAIYIADDPEEIAKLLAKTLKDKPENFNKSYAEYLIDNINEGNIQKFLTIYKEKNAGIHFTTELKKAGKDDILDDMMQYLVDSDIETLQSEEFKKDYGITYKKISRYAKKCTSNEEINEFVNSFIATEPKEIAANLIAMYKRNSGDITTNTAFKLTIKNIPAHKLEKVFAEFEKETGKTLLDVIMQDRATGYRKRKALVTTVYNKLDIHDNETEFQEILKEEGKLFHKASAERLNPLMNKNLAIYKTKQVANDIIKKQSTVWKNNRHKKIQSKKILGKKTGKYSWQYAGLNDIKTLQDVSRITGLSEKYLREYIARENKKSKWYPCAADHETIGIGHDFHKMKEANPKEYKYLKNATLTEPQIYQIFAYDMLEAMSGVEAKILNSALLSQAEFEALLDLSFNAGSGGMNTLCKNVNNAIEQREQKPQEAQLLMYKASDGFNHRLAAGNVTPGLCTRRIGNVMKFDNITDFHAQMFTQNFSNYPALQKAKDRIITMALDAYCSITPKNRKATLDNLCKTLNLTEQEFKSLEYPTKGYKYKNVSESLWHKLRAEI